MVAWMRANAPKGVTLPADLSAKEICRHAEQGDSLAKKASNRRVTTSGVGLGNLQIMMFCPDVIALGGGVMTVHIFLWTRAQVVRKLYACAAAKTELLMASMGADTD